MKRVAGLALLLALAWAAAAWHFPTPPPPAPGPDDGGCAALGRQRVQQTCAEDAPGSFEDPTESDDNAYVPKPVLKPDGTLQNVICVGDAPSSPPPPEKDFLPRDAASCSPLPPPPGEPPIDPATAPLHYCILDVADDDQVVFVNYRTGSFDATVNLATGLPWQLTSPQAMTLTPNRRTMIVTNLGDGLGGVSSPPHVTIIDVASRTISGRVTLPDGTRVKDVVTSPDGALAYVGAWEDGPDPFASANPRILIVDIAQRLVVAELSVPTRPENMAMTPDGALLFFHGRPDRGSNVIEVVDLGSRTHSATIVSSAADVVFRIGHIAVTPDGSKAFVGPTVVSFSPERVDGVAVLNTQTLEWLANIPLGQLVATTDNRTDLEITPDGSRVFFGDAQVDKVFEIDAFTNRLIAEFDVGPGGVGPIFTFSSPPGL